jgi:hypothetical protein
MVTSYGKQLEEETNVPNLVGDRWAAAYLLYHDDVWAYSLPILFDSILLYILLVAL